MASMDAETQFLAQIKEDVELVGERIIVRPMVRSDLDQMQRWRTFDEPLSQTWNLTWHTRGEMERWFNRRAQDPTYLLYAVTLHDGRLIGRLSLRHVRPGDSAVLGISFDADWIDQGYGTETLRLFTPYYFEKLGFRVLWLDVAATNLRAIRCYEKCGFVRTGGRYQPIPLEEDLSFLEEPENAPLRRYFKTRLGRTWLLFHDMKLEPHNCKAMEGVERRNPR